MRQRPMKIAILEPDLDELDRALETFSTSGHLCFGATCDAGLRRLLDEVSVDALLLDWSDPDRERYEILHHLAQFESAIPIILCVSPHTPCGVIESGLERGASFSIEKPFRNAKSLDALRALATSGFSSAFLAGNRIM
jgi:DNA-binding response OmpR family regulator